MNYEELELLKSQSLDLSIFPYELRNKEPRTLLYGYTFDRNTWHFYLNDDQKFTLLIYDSDFGNYLTDMYIHKRACSSIIVNDFCTDVKRLYPESCDFEFCKLAISRGMHLPFTEFYNDRYELNKGLTFHGRTH